VSPHRHQRRYDAAAASPLLVGKPFLGRSTGRWSASVRWPWR